MPQCWNGIQCSLRTSSLGVRISPAVPCARSSVVEHLTFNPRVKGSSPFGRTNTEEYPSGEGDGLLNR